MRENPPDPSKIQRGFKARKERMEAALKKLSFRIDKDIINQFQQLTSSGQDCGKSINQALREWLATKDIKKLIRTELRQVVREEISSFQADIWTMKVAAEQSPFSK